MNAAVLLAAALLAAPASDVAAGTAKSSDADVRAQAEALLGTIDRPVDPARWKALGPGAVPVLLAVATSESALPSRRGKALAALGAADAAAAEPLARALLDAPDAPLSLRQVAARTLGAILPPDALRAALAPVLRAAPEPDLRATAAETLARHAPASSCVEIRDQAASEGPLDRVRFERAAALCGGR
jgi:hypothetical protein